MDNRLVAVKQIVPRGLSAQDLQEATRAFLREMWLLARLAHPNLPAIYDAFEDGAAWYLVVQLIEGETLQAWGRPAGRPLEEVCAIGVQACAALEYLHNQEPPIIIRNLNPSGLMVTPAGHLYVIAFGIARYLEAGKDCDTVVLGTAERGMVPMVPYESAAIKRYGRGKVTPQADLWSLGAILHYLLTGDDPAGHPFVFPLFPQLERVSRPMRHLLEQMLSINPSARPASASVVRGELEAILAGLPK